MTETSEIPLYVTLWGTRGSISTPGRPTEKYGGNTPCVSVSYGDTTVIIDAGTGLRNLGLDLMEDYSEKGSLDLHLMLSHTHWDHIQGLPFFQPAYLPGVTINVYGLPRKGGFLESVLEGQMDEEYFPVSMQALNAEVKVQELDKSTMQIGDLKVEWQDQIYHPGGCIRFRISAGGKTMVYASDVEMNHAVEGKDTDPEKAKHLQDYLNFIEGADLLIGDGQYTPEEYTTKKNFGHTTIPVLIELARKAKVKQLAIFHHDPQHSDNMLDEYMADMAAQFGHKQNFSFYLAREGLTLSL